MGIRFDRLAALAREERHQLYKWTPDLFRARALRAFPTRPFPQTIVLREDDAVATPIGAVGYLEADALVNGVPCQVAGFGGLVVRPPFQGRGYSRLLLRAVIDQAAARQLPAVLAWCQPHLVRFYVDHHHATLLACPVRILRDDGAVVPTPQTSLWWPLDPRVREVDSLTLAGGRRW